MYYNYLLLSNIIALAISTKVDDGAKQRRKDGGGGRMQKELHLAV